MMKRLLFTLILVCGTLYGQVVRPPFYIPPPPPLATIPVYQTHNSGAATSASSSLTVSITVSAGSNLGMWAAIWLADNVTMTATYNSIPVPQVRITTYDASAGKLWMGFLVAPSTGTHDLVFTPSSDSRMVGGGVVFTGVSQSAPTSNDNVATGNSLAPSVTITSATNQMICAVGVGGSGWTSLSADAPADQRWAAQGGDGYNGGGSTRAGQATSTVMSFTAGTSGQAWTMMGCAINGI